MPNRFLVSLRLPMMMAVGLAVLPAMTASAEPTADDDAAALALLGQAQRAASSLGYEGTEVISTWTPTGTTTRMVDVRQLAGGPRWLTVRQTGSAGQSTTLSRSSGQAGSQDSELGSATGPLTLLSRTFRLQLGGTGVVAGREATVVEAHRGSKPAAKMWLDDSTGLMLRQEVMDSAGRLIRVSSFVDVRLSSTPFVPRQHAQSSLVGTARGSDRVERTSVSRPDRKTAPRTDTKTETDAESRLRGTGLSLVAELRDVSAEADEDPAEGAPVQIARSWGINLPATLPGGFALVGVRQLDPALTPGAGTAVQATYSDGLSALSLFRQPGHLAGPLPELREQMWNGARVYLGHEWPVRVVWEGGNTVLTVVSDAPVEDIRSVVEALPHKGQGSDDLLDRLGQGMADMVVELVPGL